MSSMPTTASKAVQERLMSMVTVDGAPTVMPSGWRVPPMRRPQRCQTQSPSRSVGRSEQ